MSEMLTPMTELAAELKKHGVILTYAQLHNRAYSNLFPTRKINRALYAVGRVADLAKLLKDTEKTRRQAAA